MASIKTLKRQSKSLKSKSKSLKSKKSKKMRGGAQTTPKPYGQESPKSAIKKGVKSQSSQKKKVFFANNVGKNLTAFYPQPNNVQKTEPDPQQISPIKSPFGVTLRRLKRNYTTNSTLPTQVNSQSKPISITKAQELIEQKVTSTKANNVNPFGYKEEFLAKVVDNKGNILDYTSINV